MMVRAFIAAAAFLVMSGCSEAKPYIYHQVDGEARLSGTIDSADELSIGYADYGAATFIDGRLSMHVNAGSARILAAASDIEGQGTYSVEAISVTRIGTDQPQIPFECITTCRECTMTITDMTDDLVAGTLTCLDLKNCTEPTLPPESLEGNPCSDLTAHLLNVSADFRLTGSSTRPKQY